MKIEPPTQIGLNTREAREYVGARALLEHLVTAGLKVIH